MLGIFALRKMLSKMSVDQKNTVDDILKKVILAQNCAEKGEDIDYIRNIIRKRVSELADSL